MDTFQKRLIQAMEIRGTQQVDLAEKSGLPKTQISQYKNGKYEPMQDALYKLAKALSVNVEWLMGHDVPMETDPTSGVYVEVTVAELELLKAYRYTGAETQAAIRAILHLED